MKQDNLKCRRENENENLKDEIDQEIKKNEVVNHDQL